MQQLAPRYDVLVAGGGNAALCAAITAASRGARVLVCEAAPHGFRGGNSRHTRNLRVAHEAPTGVLTEQYLDDEYFEDLLAVTGGETDESLARLVIGESHHLPAWMREQGVRFQKSLGGTLSLSRTNPFFLGGGKALLNAYYLRAAELGVTVAYNAEVVGLDMEDGVVRGARLRHRGFEQRVEMGALVAAAGGFQANIDWMCEAWGEAARNFLIRGTPYAQGSLLRELLDAGMQPVGKPDQVGFAILDARALADFMPSIFPPLVSDSIEGLADKLGLDRAALRATVDGYNVACSDGDFDPARHDALCTTGLAPAKSNWARRIRQSPFYGYPLRPGITFTYLGVRVDRGARVQMADGRAAANIWAAGEIMAGNVLGKGYLAGIGMTIGTVFGRIAGEEAARHVRN